MEQIALTGTLIKSCGCLQRSAKNVEKQYKTNNSNYVQMNKNIKKNLNKTVQNADRMIK